MKPGSFFVFRAQPYVIHAPYLAATIVHPRNFISRIDGLVGRVVACIERITQISIGMLKPVFEKISLTRARSGP